MSRRDGWDLGHAPHGHLPERRRIQGVAEPEGVNIKPGKRACDALRERYVEHLTECLGLRYLTEEEFDARRDMALSAVTEDQLQELIYDLPALKEEGSRRIQAERWLTDRWHRIMTHLAVIVGGICLGGISIAAMPSRIAGWLTGVVEIPSAAIGFTAAIASLVWLIVWLLGE